jgi:Zn-dependent peptidase ImmA (M78 family)
MASYTVDVSPDVLVWARETVGLSREDAARKLHMSDLDLRFLEEGVGAVSIPKLREMAEIYDRPFIAFFRSAPLPPEDELPDFRLKPETRGAPWSVALHKAFRRVAGQREIAIELARLAEEPPPQLDLDISAEDDPDDAGARLREWLHPDISSDASDRVRFNAWSASVEDRGILVVQVSGVAPDEMRGFSIAEEPFPIVALNGSDAIQARSFTLIHEVVHVLLRRASLCDLDDISPEGQSAVHRLERFCDATAAACLMPRTAVLGDDIVRRAGGAGNWTAEDLRELAARFGVSQEAMLVRLVGLGRASWAFYFARRRMLAAKPVIDEPAPGFANYYRMTVRNLGRRYVSMVVDAQERGDISQMAAARFLNVRLKNIPRLLAQLGAQP